MSGLPRSLGILSHKHHRVASQLASVLPNRFAGAMHSLFEILCGEPPPNGGSPLFIPHEHGRIAVPVPRQTMWVIDWGDVNYWNWIANNTGSGWWRSDFSGSALGTGSNNDVYPPNLKLPVTRGIDNSINAEGGGLCRMEFKMYYDATFSSIVRLRNRTLGQYTTTYSAPAGQGWISGEIPVADKTWNDIDVEAGPAFPAITTTFTVFSLIFAERRSVSQPLSDGANTMAAAPKP